jgi:hypothetical protein
VCTLELIRNFPDKDLLDTTDSPAGIALCLAGGALGFTFRILFPDEWLRIGFAIGANSIEGDGHDNETADKCSLPKCTYS